MTEEGRPKKLIDVTGQNAALLSAVEIGLGSLLHGFRVPLAGQCLSLNQGFILARVTLKYRQLRLAGQLPLNISAITAILKSLSPAGKKLTPMLAIAMQGLLFSSGTIVFGANLLGVLVGMALLSVWAYLQPLILYYFLYGQTMIEVLQYMANKLAKVFSFEPDKFLGFIGLIICAKVLIALALGILAYYLPEARFQQYKVYFLSLSKKRLRAYGEGEANHTPIQNARLAFSDLMNPLFIMSMVCTFIFLFFVKETSAQMVWSLLRPLALGFLIFFAVRMVSFESLFTRLEKMGAHSFSASFRVAVRSIKRI